MCNTHMRESRSVEAYECGCPLRWNQPNEYIMTYILCGNMISSRADITNGGHVIETNDVDVLFGV
jgi:hypothetical protein